jgi:glycosyltransferase involved in cell wall biosynthesis
MRTIIFSWEYPPRVIGNISVYVKALSRGLAARKVDVNVVTYDNLPSQTQEATGEKIVKVANPVQTHIGVLTWILTLNQEVERAAANIYYDAANLVDVIDVYDWHFIPAAATLKNGLGIPFVYSVESLEDHRSNFAKDPVNMAIKSIEWLGFYDAGLVSVKSDWMRDEIIRIYKVPKEKIQVISTDPLNWISNVTKQYRVLSGESN